MLDEPTTDLDIDSLELLEQTLQTYPGTLILVSHDRRFLDNVVTEVLAPEGDGLWREYVGGYSDWQHYRPKSEPEKKKTESVEKAIVKRVKPVQIKLTYKENKELETLPERLIMLESERDDLLGEMNSGDFYTKHDAQSIKDYTERFQNLEKEISLGYQRWEELENKKALSQTNK